MSRKLKTTEIERISAEQYRQAEKMPLVIVLDNVRSMHNIGSVFRTADAFRAEEIFLCGITAQPPHNDIHKTALGAEDSVRWTYVNDTTEAVRTIRERGYKVFAVEQCEGSVMMPADEIRNWKDIKGCAVVLGNEVHGVAQHVIDMCDTCIEIPQHGTKHSLNVSVTAGIVIWEFARYFYNKTE